MTRASVLLPEPLGPRIAPHAPAGSDQFTSRTSHRSPRSTPTSERLSPDIAAMLAPRSPRRQGRQGKRRFSHRGTESTEEEFLSCLCVLCASVANPVLLFLALLAPWPLG